MKNIYQCGYVSKEGNECTEEASWKVFNIQNISIRACDIHLHLLLSDDHNGVRVYAVEKGR